MAFFPTSFTPGRSELSLMPVAQKIALSPFTRSSQVKIRSNSFAGVCSARRARPHLQLHPAAERFQRDRRKNAFGRAADATIEVHAGVGQRRRDRRRDVAVGDEPKGGAAPANAGNQFGVTRALVGNFVSLPDKTYRLDFEFVLEEGESRLPTPPITQKVAAQAA